MRKKAKNTGQTILIEPKCVVTRRSTDIVAAEDAELAKALKYIHEHACEKIKADDVAAAAGLSGSELRRRFTAVLGHPIGAEIRRVRTEAIKSLLASTDMTVYQIAMKLGCDLDHHIHRFFRTETGMTPTEFRAKYRNRQ
jgi:LacI family transcriptional regulator